MQLIQSGRCFFNVKQSLWSKKVQDNIWLTKKDNCIEILSE